ncbi:TVP38/TMEM64 family protein [Sphingopyxis sp. GW247-27LB]|nr:TVP38/TMEM64 family protein [Sphingopyxis sp. GW247-27LB]
MLSGPTIMVMKSVAHTSAQRRLILFGFLFLSAFTAKALGLDPIKLISAIQSNQNYLAAAFESNPLPLLSIFVFLHILALTLSLPGAVLPFCVVAGAIFGPLWGSVIIVASLTVGDSLGFLVARHLLRDWIRERCSKQLTYIEREISSNGALYLLSLRLSAAVPFFVINVGMALTRMRLRIFAPVSLLGLIPSSILYVNAGSKVAVIRTPADVLSPQLIISLVLLGVLPLLMKALLSRTWSKHVSR